MKLQYNLLRLFSKKPRVEESAETSTRRVGDWGEALAADYLREKGYQIMERSLRLGKCEVDIIARHGDAKRAQLVFVEVKTRRSSRYGGPLAAIDKKKKQNLRRAAARYMRRFPRPSPPFRFDAVAIIGHPENEEEPRITHYQNIFRMNSRMVTPWLSARTKRGTERG